VYDLIPWLPFMITGVVLSLGYLFFSLNNPFTQFLYGTKYLLVLILALTVMTFSVQMLGSILVGLGVLLALMVRKSGYHFGVHQG
jgi:ABC-type Fe3+ transport system permease subunit